MMIHEENKVKKVMIMIKAVCFNAYSFRSEDDAIKFALNALFKISDSEK